MLAHHGGGGIVAAAFDAKKGQALHGFRLKDYPTAGNT